MQKKTAEEGLSAQRLGLIMKSARQDSTLRERIRTAVQEKRQAQMGGESMGGANDGNEQREE
jgi:hypothetical protein